MMRTLYIFALFLALTQHSGAMGEYGGNAPWRTPRHARHSFEATNVRWSDEAVSFSNSHHMVSLYYQSRRSVINGVTYWLNAPTRGNGAKSDWRISGVDLDLLRLAVLAGEEDEGDPPPLHVMLDPGHGGSDNGASSRTGEIKEKDLALELALMIGAVLTNQGMRVSFTRNSDMSLTLVERVRLARKSKAELFVSIHANHATNSDAQGVETYVLPSSGHAGTATGSRARGWQIGNRNDYQNNMLGFLIHRQLLQRPDAVDRGVKRQSFFVLREVSCPSVLLELGFLSNKREVRRMLTPEWRSQNAAAVADGIVAYARRLKTLEQSVTAKRQYDEEANMRWRQHLAERKALRELVPTPRESAESPPPLPLEEGVVELDETGLCQPRPGVAHIPMPPAVVARLNAPILPLSRLGTNRGDDLEPLELQEAGGKTHHTSATILTGTNVAPVRIEALMDFYKPDKAVNHAK